MYFSAERNKTMAERLFRHVRDNTTDLTAEIFEYDIAIYADPAIAAHERETIFKRLPIMAAHASQLPEPGSFITLQLSFANAIITRQRDGSLRAFLNICRHRGAAVVPQPQGKRHIFTCPYHGWSYDTDGTHRNITFDATFGESACAQRNLIALPVEERHGFIWLTENPAQTINVAAFLGPGMDQALAEYHFETWHFYKDHVFDFPQNWKVMMDGLIDGYHVQFLHGKTISPYFYPNMLSMEVHGRHALWGNPRRAIDKIVNDPPGSVPLDRYVIFGNLITPNSVLVLHPHHVEYWTVYPNPQNPAACRLHLRYLTPSAEHDQKSHDVLAKNWEIATAAILNEDVPVGNAIQRSAAAGIPLKLCLGKNEMANQVFHRAYQQDMQRD